MFSDECFRQWILQTIQPLLEGNVMNPGEFCEWSLTYEPTRMVDCQGGFTDYFHSAPNGFMRNSGVVTTNTGSSSKKPTLH